MTPSFERLQSPSPRVTFCRRIVSKEMRSFVTSLDSCPFNPDYERTFQHSPYDRGQRAGELVKESSQVMILERFI